MKTTQCQLARDETYMIPGERCQEARIELCQALAFSLDVSTALEVRNEKLFHGCLKHGANRR